ncbi:MAG: LysR substrate-binding domain-containing protein [Candidatus Limnocylindria bacterium]
MDVEARLRAFAAVARRGSFSRAAADLGISQPAVSKHVADLEAQVGTRLLIREARGARLTEAGELLASHVSRAEALLARAAAGLASLTDAATGRLTIAASGTPGVYLLPRAIAAFAAARPRVELDVHLGTSAVALDLVRAHGAEVAIVGGMVAAADLEVEPLVEDEIVIIGPPGVDGTTKARDVERLTWISREEGSGTRAAADAALDALGVLVNRRLVLPDWEMIKGAVAAGAGVAAVSRFAVEHELASGRLRSIQLQGWHVVRPLSMVYARDVPLTPLADHFIVTIRQAIGRSDDRLERARAALTYAERSDGKAPVDEIQRVLAGAAAELAGETDPERRLLARIDSLRVYWHGKQGAFEEAWATLDEALARPHLPDAARADLSARGGWLAGRQGDWPRAETLLEEALEAARGAGDAGVERRVLLELAGAHSAVGRHDRAQSVLDDSLRAARVAGDDDELLRALNNGAAILEAAGEPARREAAAELLLEGVERARRVADRHHLAWLQLNVAVGLMRRGMLRAAEQRLEEALALFQALGELGGTTPAANLLGWVRLKLGDVHMLQPLLEIGRRDRYGGSDLPPPGHAEMLAVLRWRSDRRAALDGLRTALVRASGRGEADTIRGWLLMARMAVRLRDSGRIVEARDAIASLELLTLEERQMPRWFAALGRTDRRRASAALAALAAQFEELGSVIDAADAYADAAVVASAAGNADAARQLTADRDRLLVAAAAVPLLDEPLRAAATTTAIT